MKGGIRLYLAVVAVNGIVPIDVKTLFIITLALVFTYTFIGGYTAVVWTDVVQIIFVILLALFTCWYAWGTSLLDIGFTKMSEYSSNFDRMSLDSERVMTLNLYTRESGIWIIFNTLLQTTARLGMDQDMVQRIIACKGGQKGAKKAIFTFGAYLTI